MKSDEQKGGRPEAEIDPEQLCNLAKLQATIAEAAGFFRCSERTLHRRLREDPKCQEAWDAGRNIGKLSLRRQVWKLANGSGSSAVSAAVHLSKHWLGQSDKSLVEIAGKDGAAIEFDFSRLDTLSIKEIKVLERLVEKLGRGPR